MGGTDAVSNTVRFFLFLFVQVFLFRQVNLGFAGHDYLYLMVSPVFIALLPLRTAKPLVVVLAFLLGLGTDLFYESLGVHMAAATLTGYARAFIVLWLAPKDGYKVKANPSGQKLGFSWWMRYLAVILAVYLLWYFCMEAFSPVFWRDIALKFIVSLPLSWIISLVFLTLLRPRI